MVARWPCHVVLEAIVQGTFTTSGVVLLCHTGDDVPTVSEKSVQQLFLADKASAYQILSVHLVQSSLTRESLRVLVIHPRKTEQQGGKPIIRAWMKSACNQ